MKKDGSGVMFNIEQNFSGCEKQNGNENAVQSLQFVSKGKYSITNRRF